MTREEAIKVVMENYPHAGFSGSQFETALRTLIPELAESEYERVRKWLYNYISNCPNESFEFYGGVGKDAVLAWLEKQKEKKQTLDLPAGFYFIDKNGKKYYTDTLKCGNLKFIANQKEQKPAEWDKLQADFRNINEAFEDGKKEVVDNPEKYGLCRPAEWSESDTLMCNAALQFLRSHPNLMASRGINKSSVIKWLKSFSQHRREIIDEVCSKAGISMPYLDGNQWCILKGDDIQSGIVGFGDTNVDALANFIKEAFIHKPKPVEWSEEDEHRRKDAIYFLESAKKHYADTSEIEKTIAWLKFLSPQPKPEWTEEDEKVIEAACALLCEYAGYYKEKDMEAKDLQLFKVSQRLKSLRPQPKDETYKEKDEAFKFGKHQLAIGFMNYLDENRPEGKMSLSNGECEDIDKAFKENDWAKIMRYVEKYSSLWKPSEEQMEALKEDIDFAPDTYKLRCTLVSLYNDLKKL